MTFTCKLSKKLNKYIFVRHPSYWRRPDFYFDIFGYIFAFSVFLVGLFLFFPNKNVEYVLLGAEIGGIVFSGTALGLIIVNIKKKYEESNLVVKEKNLFYLNMLFESLKKWNDEKKLSYTSFEDDKLSKFLWYEKDSTLPLVYIHIEIIDKYINFKIRFRSKENIQSIFTNLNRSMIRLGTDGKNIIPIKRTEINEKNMIKVHQTILDCTLNPLYEIKYITSM